MQVIFESRDPQGAELRDQAVTRLKFVMRRLSSRVPRAKLLLSDINGPRGGVDKRCQLELTTDGTGTVVITSVARDWRSAIDQTLARAGRVVQRTWQRGRQEAGAARGRPPLADQA